MINYQIKRLKRFLTISYFIDRILKIEKVANISQACLILIHYYMCTAVYATIHNKRMSTTLRIFLKKNMRTDDSEIILKNQALKTQSEVYKNVSLTI